MCARARSLKRRDSEEDGKDRKMEGTLVQEEGGTLVQEEEEDEDMKWKTRCEGRKILEGEWKLRNGCESKGENRGKFVRGRVQEEEERAEGRGLSRRQEGQEWAGQGWHRCRRWPGVPVLPKVRAV